MMILLDARSDSLTVSWPAIEGATTYTLEYHTAEETEFALLSDKLSQTQARKRNLSPSTDYFFRVSTATADVAITNTVAFSTLSTSDDEASMAAPTVTHPGNQHTLLVAWSPPSTENSTPAYELQMRENLGGADWMVLTASFASTQVKKKNLTSTLGYQFRVRPSVVANDDSTSAVPQFSPTSDAVVARRLSPQIARFFSELEDGTLLSNPGAKPVPLADALGGKEFVLIYASAHWCPPCRNFTPKLAQWYNQSGVRSSVEIVFVSCDHDAKGFNSYYNTSHPWLAVDFADDAREQLLGAIKVQGIPRLVVMSAKSGRILEDNAVGQPFDIQRWRNLDK